MGLQKCKECQSEVSDDAEECPNCGVANPSGSMKVWWRSQGCFGQGCMLTVVAFVAFMIVGIIGSATSSDDAGESQTQSNATTSAEPQTVGVGEAFELGNFSYRIDKIESTNQIGDGPLAENAGSGAQFAIVWFTIENLGNSSETVLANDFKIETPTGTSYESFTKANTALSMQYSNKDLMLSELQPGLEKSTATVFKVPTDVLSDTFYVSVPEKSWLSNKSVRIEVSPSEVR